MDIKEIVKNAPEGATHYRIIRNSKPDYYRMNGDRLEFFNNIYGGWRNAIIIRRISDLEPLPKPKTRTEYVKVAESIFDLKGEFERGELYYTFGNGKWETFRDERSLFCGIKDRNIYRRIEKEVDWRDETANYLAEKSRLMHSPDHLIWEDGDTFLEMCRIALRATGEIE